MSFLLLFFYFLILISAVFMVTVVNPINAVLFLISIFFNTSMVFILLNIDFLGLLFLMIYVGAIAVLFLFVVMMLNIRKIEKDSSFYLTIGIFLLLSYLLQLFFIFFHDNLIYIPRLFMFDLNLFSFSSISLLDESARFLIIKKIGILLYYEYFFFLLFGALILFAAMIGAIYLTNEKQGYSMRHQYDQLARNHYIFNVSIY
ncbi:NADH dehydrogenase subunit 6 (mitochondrion) [Naegleria fowleri]|uniref:NADH-ubiquinone oxidoreductase chain 6 n=1 Tax=Naegleria fowleri TaxID=5763 RepID=M4H6Q2_NAEFO|nr:NADH dehydrogenase subunit 6 [Naegleria fowleri]AFP72309.1 NADH dehydrogenase subunit 6 [Naegleria fowleri]AOS85628.1 Nad6 [Naegleria fowleri]AOS85674.1 Nad6 [Naegleria fowleri]UAT97077.1 NADH dehydrogenase subunit 6 [Naegleria fowleri]WND64447.1 NADH-quinone oxidoreductase subunit J [Naegleria fowleri]